MKQKKTTDSEYRAQRLQMVEKQLVSRDIHDPKVLKAMRTVHRHLFIPETRNRDSAYADGPQSIGRGQTISQPYVVASMTQELQLKSSHKVLEIGTGCGYQAAVLAEIVKQVFTIEIIPDLAERADKTLSDLGYKNITVIDSDGSSGWAEDAPYDAIIVTASAPKMPEGLIKQLKIGGKMVLPMDIDKFGRQFIFRITRTETGIEKEELYEVRFVPMVGEISMDQFDF